MNYKLNIKRLALLLAAAASSSAWAQTTLEPGKTYVLTNISAAAGDNLSYQWYRNNVAIAGATDESYTLPAYLAQGVYVEFRRGVKTPSCPEYTFSNSIFISFCGLFLNNTTCWASVNVDDYQTFASRPDMLTKFYQGNRATAFPATGSSGVNWTSQGTTAWVINPCPSGWRLPTQAEFVALNSAGSTWANTYARGNFVAGRFYGPNHATCTLPNNMAGCIFLHAGGNREFEFGDVEHQNNGYYWSNMQASYHLYFYNTNSMVTTGTAPAGLWGNGYNLRCVMQ